MPELDDATLRDLRARLDAREAELGREIQALSAEQEDEPSKSPRNQAEDDGEQGEQRFREGIRHAERERDRLELREVVAARDRMDAGQYGLCIDCGTDIPLARLQVQPWAARCIACQEKAEHRVRQQG